MRCHVCAQVRSRSQPFACGHLRSHNYIIRGEHRERARGTQCAETRFSHDHDHQLPPPPPPHNSECELHSCSTRCKKQSNSATRAHSPSLPPPPPQYQTHTCFIHGSCAHEDDAIARARACTRRPENFINVCMPRALIFACQCSSRPARCAAHLDAEAARARAMLWQFWHGIMIMISKSLH